MLQDAIKLIDKGIDAINIFTTDMDPKKEEMINLLLDNGYSDQEVLALIDVVKTQAESYLAVEVGYRARDAKRAEAVKAKAAAPK